MDKIFVKDIHDKDPVDSIFFVARKATVTSKAHPFIAIQLRDKTGILDARIWDDLEGMGATFDKGDYVRIQGHALQYQGRIQVKVDAIEKIDASSIRSEDFSEPPKPAPGDRSIGQIREIVERLQDPHLKELCLSFLDDEELIPQMRNVSAARSIHHSHPGGWADHTLSVLKLSLRAADQYSMADRDMLIAGAFLHDVGKLRELAMVERQAEYTDEGRFIGHLVIGAQMIHDRCAGIQNFPPNLEMQLTHMVLAHHGSKEFGSPTVPQTLEALIVHYMDDLDSKVGALMEICQRDPATNEKWTDFQKQYNRYFYKGATATIHGKYAFESKKRRALIAREAAEKARQTSGAKSSAPQASTERVSGESDAKVTSDNASKSNVYEGGAKQPKKDARKEGGKKSDGAQKDLQKPSGEMTFKPFGALAALIAQKSDEAGSPASDASIQTPVADPQSSENTCEADVSLPEGISVAEAVESTVEAALESAALALSVDENS